MDYPVTLGHECMYIGETHIIILLIMIASIESMIDLDFLCSYKRKRESSIDFEPPGEF